MHYVTRKRPLGRVPALGSSQAWDRLTTCAACGIEWDQRVDDRRRVERTCPKCGSVPAATLIPADRPAVAFLVYHPYAARRADNSFDGNENIGAKVIADILRRQGTPVGHCTPESAHRFALVLVSFTSTYDLYAYYRAVALRPDWQPGRRVFKVLAGGFGLQNPTAVRAFVDHAAFGRAHTWVHQVVTTILEGGTPDHPSVMNLPDITPVEIAHAPLYPHEVEGFTEDFTGCPLKCKFCHYTWARKHTGTDGAYVQTMLTGGDTPELTWDQLATWNRKAGRLRVAIDGFSERLRYLYGKPISDADIKLGVERVGRFEGVTTLLVYNIASMPTETDADRESLYSTLADCNPRNRVVFVLHSTPFRPSPATPMQWEPASLAPDWSALRGQAIVEKPTLRAVHSYTLESPWVHLLSLVAERATPATDPLFHALAFASGLQRAKVPDRLRLVDEHFDTAPYVRAHDPAEPPPTWFLHGQADNSQLASAALRMRTAATQSLTAWQRPRSSLVQTSLRRQGALEKCG